MKAFWLITAALLVAIVACDGQTSTKPANLVVWHDPQRKVTCWVWQTTGYNGALSCLPDASFEPGSK